MTERRRQKALAAAWQSWQEGLRAAAWARQAAKQAVLFWCSRALATAWAGWAARAAARARLLDRLKAIGAQLHVARLQEAFASWRHYAQQRSFAQGRATGPLWLWGSLLAGRAFLAWVIAAQERRAKHVLAQHALQHWIHSFLAKVGIRDDIACRV
jgi:hypothetical protein